MNGCTYNISMVHIDGNSSDALDNNASADTKVDPQISLPVVP